MAFEHTKYISAVGDKDKAEDLLQSTIVPELLLNICQAQLYLEKESVAIKSAKLAIEQSLVRQNLL